MSRANRLIAPLLLSFLVASSALASDPTVYVTEQGKKYHQKNCRLKHGSKGIKLSEAKKKGYKPCEVCKPPK
ncbi:MAG: hypothetical protein U0S12_06460 [Fimbriimonadales bacterium]